MAGDHVGLVSKGVQRPLDGQVGRQHGGLRVFGLLQFVLGFHPLVLGQRRTKDETGEGLAVQHLHHGFIGLVPNLLCCGKPLNEVRRHADVLAALSGVHVGNLGFVGKRWLVGDHDALRLQEAPLFRVMHRLGSQTLPLGELRPRRRNNGHADRCGGIEADTPSLKFAGQPSATGVVVEQRTRGIHGHQRRFEFGQGTTGKQQHTAFQRLQGIMSERGRSRPVQHGRGSRCGCVRSPALLPCRCQWCMDVGLIALKRHVEVRPTEAKGRDAGTARVAVGPRPFTCLGGYEEGDIGPVHGGVGGLEIGAWGDGAMVKRHHRLHDASNTGRRLEVTDLRFDGTHSHLARTLHIGPQPGERGQFGGIANFGRRPVGLHQFYR